MLVEYTGDIMQFLNFKQYLLVGFLEIIVLPCPWLCVKLCHALQFPCSQWVTLGTPYVKNIDGINIDMFPVKYLLPVTQEFNDDHQKVIIRSVKMSTHVSTSSPHA